MRCLILIGIFSIGSVICLAQTPAQLEQQIVALQNRPTPQQIGMLRWYQGISGTNVEIGLPNVSLTFDGLNIWALGIQLTKVRASDDVIQGSPIYPGGNPYSVVFDGASLWVANNFDKTLARVHPTTGAIDIFSLASLNASPFALAFDGANIWATASGNRQNMLIKVRASDGTILGHFATGPIPVAVAYDGATVWVAAGDTNIVNRFRASDGLFLGNSTVGANPDALAFDGTNIWVANLW